MCSTVFSVYYCKSYVSEVKIIWLKSHKINAMWVLINIKDVFKNLDISWEVVEYKSWKKT